MEDTIFTKIVKGEIPCYKIAENDKFFAFLDISPIAKGHTLVITKLQNDYIFDLPDDLLGEMMVFAKKVAVGIREATEDAVSAMEPSACINCAKCVEVCPERLIPKNLADDVEHGQEEKFLAEYGMECCECGCCSYICPARRQLTQLIKGMRKIQLGKRKK